LNEYIDQSPLDVYDKVTHKGFWRLLLTRTQKSGEGTPSFPLLAFGVKKFVFSDLKHPLSSSVMAVIQVHPQKYSNEDVDREIEAAKSHLLKRAQEGVYRLDTLLYQKSTALNNMFSDDFPIHLLHGSGTIEDNLLGSKFRISPTAFFQPNPWAAEVLYDLLKKKLLEPMSTTVPVVPKETAEAKAEPSAEIASDAATTTTEVPPAATETSATDDKIKVPPTVTETSAVAVTKAPMVLDLCCGTGTIGIIVSDSAEKVIGVEMVKGAIEDANLNASLNSAFLLGLFRFDHETA
jgi:tRNA (uracil-5-)-methyltransferase